MPSTSLNLRKHRGHKGVEIVIFQEWGENQVDQVDPYQQLFGAALGSTWHASQAPLEDDSEVLLEEIWLCLENEAPRSVGLSDKSSFSSSTMAM